MEGKATEPQTEAFTAPSRIKGEAIEEITGAGKLMWLKGNTDCIEEENPL